MLLPVVHLVQNAAKDKTPTVFTDHAENVVLWAIESTRFRLYMPLLCDLNIKPIIF